jgi:hypothetical protein
VADDPFNIGAFTGSATRLLYKIVRFLEPAGPAPDFLRCADCEVIEAATGEAAVALRGRDGIDVVVPTFSLVEM